MATTAATGTRDITYDLVSVLYHALQGAETYQAYIQDADEAGDREAATFLRGAQKQMVQLSGEAKSLLGRRLGGGGNAGGDGDPHYGEPSRQEPLYGEGGGGA
jgi:hypothetical protein